MSLKRDVKMDPGESLKFTQQMVNRFGPRLAGSDASLQTADAIKKEFNTYADTVDSQDFEVHPKAFLDWIKALVVVTVIALILLWLNQPLAAAIIQTVGMLFPLQFLTYRDEFDIFWKKETARNVWATIEPSKEAKQQIIVSGHHDSAYIFNYLKNIPQYNGLLMLVSFVFIFILLFFEWIWGIQSLLNSDIPTAIIIGRILITVIVIIFLIPFWFFRGSMGTPGAGDNMIAVAIANQLGRLFAQQKKQGSGLQYTRLIIASWDAEEAGLRGARAFCKKYASLVQSLPTFNFNIDSIYRTKLLCVITSDINGFVKLSDGMVKDSLEIAQELGYPLKAIPFPFLAGGTDAGEFAKIGAEATTLLAMPLPAGSLAGSKTEYFNAYHTPDDTVDKIEPESVKASLEIIYSYIRKKDTTVL
jgi:aminopeptidase YwaD